MIENETKIIPEEKNILLNYISDKENKSRENYSYDKNNNSNNININKLNTNNIFIPLSDSTNFASKCKEINSIELKKDKKINFKPFYSAFSAKNIIKIFSTNAEVSSFSLINKSNTPTNHHYILNKLNKENIQNFIQTNKNKPFFGSMLFKNNSHKNVIKKYYNQEKNEEKNINDKNINKILLKYSKDYKNNNMNQKEKELDNILEKIKIKKDINELNKENKENIIIKDKIRNKNKIPFNQKIFKKIIEEVKDEKNYIQKVVHRKIINNQKEYFRNSLIKDNFKKYDTKTYNKEIATKKIKNPLNISINKESKDILNRNYSTNRELNLKTDINVINKNILNLSSANYSNNINDEIISKKKNSIKIKKIPLSKLKHKIKINNPIITNYIYSKEKNNNYFNDMNCNTQRIILPKNNLKKFHDNSFTNIFSNNYSFSQNYQRPTEIPKNNNYSLYGSKQFNLENSVKDMKRNILYNKVNLKKRKIRINLNNNLNTANKFLIYEKNANNKNNKFLIEKKMGLFKKKLAGISSDKQNNIDNGNNYLSLSNINNKRSKIYNKKINNTIFKSYMYNNNNNYIKNNFNESDINKYYINFNSRYNDINKTCNTRITNNYTTESMTNTNKTRNINYQKLRNNIFKKEHEISKSVNFIKEEIKLEQIITLLNFEDLLIIEDKLNSILKIIKTDKNSPEEFFDLFNYFFSSSLKPKFEQIYKYLLKETEAIKVFINHSLILIIICYDFYFNKNTNNSKIKFSLYESIRLIYINLLMAISPIKNKIISENKDFYNLRLIEMSGINNIIDKNLINFSNSTNEDDISFKRELLHNNTNLLITNISLIIKIYNQNKITELYYSMKSDFISFDEINNFFRQNILREDFIGCSVLASTFLKEKENFALSPIPYITTPSSKKYCLVLDLDETLIHFKVNHSHNDEGVLKLRPGISTFLEVIKDYYEIILFTEASEAYTELIMETFNKNNFFDFKFFRQHTIIIGQDFVKDLQRIGRPLDRIIIIDNMAQNFRMQKYNGILIKPFYGEDQNDRALIDLIPILINISKDNLDTRNGLVKYKDEIITKITSNLFRRNNSDK